MKYPYLALVGFLIWFIGTWHGGFSMEPQSNFERLTDFVGPILMVWGIIGDILSGVEIHKVDKSVHNHDIHTQNVDFKYSGKKPVVKNSSK